MHRSTASLLLLFATTAVAQTPLHLELVVAGLTRPVLVTAPPGDLHRVFVVEHPGRIRVVRDGALLPAPFLDLTGTGLMVYGGEAGMLGLAFHPDYAQNGTFFVCRTGAPYVQAVVERYTVAGGNPDVADPASRTVVLTTPLIYGNHNGGTVAFGPDGFLYVTIGDGGSLAPLFPNDPFNNAQRGDTWLGKILRIDVDHPAPPLQYGIPPGNPFAGPGDPLDEIWAFGVRNPWRCSFDRLTGDFWITDVGGHDEEIDLEPRGSPGGRNYGWSCMAGTWCNGSTVCTCFGPALTPPLFAYDLPAPQAIIGGYVYRGVAIPDLRGSYFFADYAARQIASLRQVGGAVTQLVDRTAELVPPAPYAFTGITGFGEDGYGELYVCDLGGEVYRIVPDTPSVVGAVPYGAGTPGCSGPQALAATSSPVLGNPAFALRSDHSPASALGLIAFAGAADVAGSDPLGVGLLLHVQPGAAFFVLDVLPSDGSGVGSYAFAIPASPPLAGIALYAQTVWAWDPAVCAPSAIGWSSSAGLAITLQP